MFTVHCFHVFQQPLLFQGIKNQTYNLHYEYSQTAQLLTHSRANKSHLQVRYSSISNAVEQLVYLKKRHMKNKIEFQHVNLSVKLPVTVKFRY